MMKHLFFLQVVLPHVTGIGWSVNLPRQIRAFYGDCVVITCSYTLPATERNKMKEIIWYQYETQEIIFNSKLRGQKCKASLVGDVTDGNCSLLIKNITREDSKVYRFLIEIPGVRNYSSSSSVDLRVSALPPPLDLQISSEKIMEGDRVIMTCMMNHSCNMRPLSLSWNQIRGEISEKTVDFGNGIWQFVSAQTFTATVSHHRLYLYCQAKSNIKNLSRSRSYILNVLYAPKNTTVTVNAGEIREGHNVSVSCFSRSNPSVSRYIWNGYTENGTLIHLTGSQSTILISYIKPNMRSVYCTAQNLVGNETSPAMELNIIYKPKINEQSHCQPTFNVMECTCTVKANPPPFITWHFLNYNITKTEEGYHVSSSISHHVTKSLIKGPASFMTSMTCYSVNKEGTDELLLPVYVDITMYLVIAGATGIAVLFTVVVAVRLLFCGRKSTEEKHTTENAYSSDNPYKFEPHSSCRGTESSALYENTTPYPLHRNKEFATKSDKEIRSSFVSDELYSLYECPHFEKEPDWFGGETVYLEEEHVYLGEEPFYLGEDTAYLGEEPAYFGEEHVYHGEESVYLGEEPAYFGEEHVYHREESAYLGEEPAYLGQDPGYFEEPDCFREKLHSFEDDSIYSNT